MENYQIALIIIGAFILLLILINLTVRILNRNYTPSPYFSAYRLDFPDEEDGHVHPSDKVHDYVYDENFDYRFKKGIKPFLKQLVKIFVLSWVSGLLSPMLFCLVIKGKKNYRQHKKELKDGFITISNHTYDFDTLNVMRAFYPKRVEFPIWKEGAESSSGNMYRYAGGLPLPRDSIKGIHYSMEAMREVLREKKWLHVFPEGACWPFYVPIREFKTGTFKLAYEEDKPIIPMASSFRQRKGLSRLFTRKPYVCLSIGEPLYANKNLEKKEAIEDLTKRARGAVIELAGISSLEENEELKKQYNYYRYESATF